MTVVPPSKLNDDGMISDMDWLAGYADAVCLDIREIDPYAVFRQLAFQAERSPGFMAQLVMCLAAMVDVDEPVLRRQARIEAITDPRQRGTA